MTLKTGGRKHHIMHPRSAIIVGSLLVALGGCINDGTFDTIFNTAINFGDIISQLGVTGSLADEYESVDLSGTWTTTTTVESGTLVDELGSSSGQGTSTIRRVNGNQYVEERSGDVFTATVTGNILTIEGDQDIRLLDGSSRRLPFKAYFVADDTQWMSMCGRVAYGDGELYGRMTATRGETPSAACSPTGVIDSYDGDSTGQLVVWADGPYDVWGGDTNLLDEDEWWMLMFYHMDEQQSYVKLGESCATEGFPGDYAYYIVMPTGAMNLDAIRLPDGRYFSTGLGTRDSWESPQWLTGPPDGFTTGVGHWRSPPDEYLAVVVVDARHVSAHWNFD